MFQVGTKLKIIFLNVISYFFKIVFFLIETYIEVTVVILSLFHEHEYFEWFH
jgi:hypothetical protein